MNDAHFTTLAADYLDEYLSRIRACVERLSQEQIWWRPNPATNSIGNLLLHLDGNLSLWVLKALGGTDFERHRSLEFTADHSASKEELLARLATTVERCRAVITGLGEDGLAAPHKIQTYETDGLGAVFHVVEHMSYHTGQIVAVTKQLLGPDHGIEFFPQHRAE